jgi:tyrosine-protein kinase Etk/Wzc
MKDIKFKEEETNMLYFLVVVLKHKKMIVYITLACALISMIISFIMKPVYKAETKILPPQTSNSGISSELGQLVSSSSGFSSGASGFISSSLGLKSENDLYVGMLKSNTMYDRIIDKFGLMKSYKTIYKEDARNILNKSVNFKNGKEGIISVSVEDKDPESAAEMANAFIDELKVMTQTFAVTEASKRRLFFEEQLGKVKEDLIKAEEAMQGLQEKTGALDMNEQAKAVITSIAELRAQIAAKEVELKVMKTYTEPRNPDLQKSEEALKGMKEELKKIEVKSVETPDPLMPAGRFPKTGAEYARKLRELKYQETLFNIIEKQYEIARVDEARDAIIVQVLDKAFPPVRKSGPKRALIIFMATFTGLFLAFFAAFYTEYAKHAYSGEENRKLKDLIREYSFFKWKN